MPKHSAELQRQRLKSLPFNDFQDSVLKAQLLRSSTFPSQASRRFSVTNSIGDLPRPSYSSVHSCDICKELLLHGEDRKKAKEVYNNPMERYPSSKLLEAAKNGCCLASICITAAAGFIKNSIAPTLSMVKTDPDSIFRFAIYTGEPDTIIEVYEHPDDLSPWPLFAPARDVSIDSTQDDCFERATGWIKDCMETHELCNIDYSDEPPTLPKRVIDVGLNGSPMKLVEIKGEYRPYAALTYCWGDDRELVPVKLLLSRHAAYNEEIPIDLLPKTLLDAILITKKLGIRYIWIDALCIIQDSPADWTIQSSRMSNIYTAAVVVIAATGAAGSKDGCFIGNRKKLRLPYTDEDGRERALYARLAQFPFFDDRADVRSDPHSLGESHLSRRGWCFQEVLLARRTLSYSKDEVLWDCMESISCECRLDGSVRHAKQQRRLSTTPQLTSHFPFLELFQEARTTPSDTNTRNIYKKWYAMLEEYTGRNLTYPSDRLPAFSGLATLMADVNHDSYHAGLWKSQLPYALLWVRHSRVPFERSEKRGDWAPSWSWASVMARVRQESPEDFTSGVEIISIDTPPAAPNPFGSVREGVLSLRAVLLPAKLDLKSIRVEMENYTDHNFEWQGTAHAILNLNDHAASFKMKIILDLGETWLPSDDSDVPAPRENVQDLGLEVNEGNAVFLMFVGIDRRLKVQDDSQPCFLVLQEVGERNGIRTFRRVGASSRAWTTSPEEIKDRNTLANLVVKGKRTEIMLV